MGYQEAGDVQEVCQLGPEADQHLCDALWQSFWSSLSLSAMLSKNLNQRPSSRIIVSIKRGIRCLSGV